jgi:peptidoglycan/LPS O-acetylase OafA/YrhL
MNAGRVAPILNAGPLVWLGDISYSLYLAHGFVQFLTTELLVSAGFQNTKNLSYASSLWLLLAMLGATLLMAAFTHREVEIVGRSRLRKLLSAWRERSSVTTRAKRIAGAAASMPKMN